MTDLVLGDITFADFEIPDELPMGGDQAIRAHEFVGNKRALDVMGATYDPISWEGRLRGPTAIERMKALEAMWLRGAEVALSWGEVSFTVVIASFKARARSVREIPYSIRCEVVRNEAAPAPASEGTSVDEMVRGDFTTAEKLTALVDEIELQEQMEMLGGAISGVPDFATAGRDLLNSVLRPALNVQETITGLITIAESVFAGTPAIGGVLPGLDLEDMAAGLVSQTDAVVKVSRLYDAAAYIGRIETNVSAVSVSGARAVVAGADLFALAGKAYGDATEWATIARANGLTDPVIVGERELVIPPTPLDSGGVLS